MAYGGYGSSKNGIRLGVFWDSISLNADGSQARINNADIKIDRDVNIVDSSNNLSWSGGAVIDGSDANINVGGSGSKVIKNCTGQWHDLVYGATSTASFSASMSGIDYAGGTISESRTVTYPARAFAAPIAPTDLIWTETGTGNFTITWTNKHTTAAPWTTVSLVRTEVGGAATVIPLSSPSTIASYLQNGMALNKRYTWYLAISNETATVYSAVTAATPIPLHSMTLTPSSAAIGGTLTFTINTYSSGNTSTISIINDLKTLTHDSVSAGTGTSASFTFSAATFDTLMSNSTSKTFYARLATYSGATLLGYFDYAFTLTVPNAAPYLPTATAPTRIEQVTAVNTAFGTGIFVKNKSKIRYTWGGAAGQAASISKREILITRSWQSGTSTVDVTGVSGYVYDEEPSGSGTVTVVSRTTDSRGRVTNDAVNTATFTVYNYADPLITTFTATRCDVNANPLNSGTYVKFTINVSATAVSTLNQMKYRIRLLDSSGNETTTELRAKALNSTLTENVTTGALGGGAYSAQSGYNFRLILDDDLTIAAGSYISKAYLISSEVYPLTIGTKGISIGKVYNDDTKALDVVGTTLLTGPLTVAGSLTFTGTLNNTVTVAELETLNGVTSNIQTQLGAKAASSHTHTLASITDVTATAAELNRLDGILPTVTELNFVDGVTSNIQTQLNSKLTTSDTGWVTMTLATGTGTSRYRVCNGVVYVQISITGASVPDSSTATDLVLAANGIPSDYRPSATVYATANMAGQYIGQVLVLTTGAVSAVHDLGSTISTVRGFIVYPVGA